MRGFHVDMKLRKQKKLIYSSSNPHGNTTNNHLEALSQFLDFHSSSYSITIILGDFDLSVEGLHMKTFCESYSLKCLIKQLTCYKNPAKPTCTDLVLNKVSRCFQSVEAENF